MRTLSTIVLTFVVVLATAASAEAQRAVFIPGMGTPGTMIVSNPGVQQELKVDDAQTQKISALVQQSREKYREPFDQLQALPQDQRPAKRLELVKTTNAELRESLGEILRPEQIKRYEQIQLQSIGYNAFASPRVQAALSLTDDQKAKLGAIIEEQNEAIRMANDNFAIDRIGTQARTASLRKQGLEKTLAILTDSQRMTWRDLAGEPFEIQFEPRRRNN